MLGAGSVHVLPHPSSVSYACARLGWPLEDTEVVTLVGRPTARLAAALHDRRRLLVLSADAATPGEVAALLRDRGFGPSRMRVLEQLGGDRERTTGETSADDWPPPHPGDGPDPLNVVAVACRRAPGALRLGAVPGLPDEAYEHDGQLTKRHVRAATRAWSRPRRTAVGRRRRIRLDRRRVDAHAPRLPGSHRRTRPRPCRADRPQRGTARRAGAAGGDRRGARGPRRTPAAGRRLRRRRAHRTRTAGRVLEALPAGGRLVANTVTLESEALLADARRRHGGEVVRLAVAHAVPVGGFTGWRQAMPVTQWAVHKTSDSSEAVPGTAGADT
ncbi:bifunctional cobalt-precorrin-7 (C(5))-methyltransferase/cobalt-precorrin-6B (C(15))-methyltransferase [Streptomyces hirsutus]